VEHALNGDQAVAALADAPDCVLLDVMRDALAHKCRHLSAENKQESCATQEPWDQPHESALWSLQQKKRADDRPYECHDEEWAQ